MLIHSELAELQTRLDLVLSAGDCLEDSLANDFWSARKPGELDYQVTVDVTDSDQPDLGQNPWFCIGGDEPNEVYLSRLDVRELAGRRLWTFEAVISANLPVRK